MVILPGGARRLVPVAAVEHVFDGVEGRVHALVESRLLLDIHGETAVNGALVFQDLLLHFEQLGQRFLGLLCEVPAVGMALGALLQLEGGKAQRDTPLPLKWRGFLDRST